MLWLLNSQKNCMKNSKSTLSFIGIGLGSVAILLAIFHFWIGPFSPQQTIEQTVAKKVVSIKQAAIAALKENSVELQEPEVHPMNTDKIVNFITAALGSLAIIFGVIGFARKDSLRVAGGAALLGSGAIAFQFLTISLGIIILVIIIGFVLS